MKLRYRLPLIAIGLIAVILILHFFSVIYG